MGWTTFPELIKEYKLQVNIIDKAIRNLKNDSSLQHTCCLENLEAMRNNLLYGISQISKHLNGKGKE